MVSVFTRCIPGKKVTLLKGTHEAAIICGFICQTNCFQGKKLFLQVYQEETGDKINGVFHQNLLMAQCQLTALSLEQCKVADAADALHR